MSRSFAFKNGFTLIDLMIVIILIAIGAALAAPSFSNIIRETRLTTQANNLLASLQLARSEAVSRGIRVTILSSSDTDQVWEGGWKVFTDWETDNDFGKFSDNNEDITDCSVEKDCLLGTASELPAGTTLRSSDEFASSIAFLPTGISDGDPDKDLWFVLCAPNAREEEIPGRSVIISETGRPYIENVGYEKCP